MGEKGTEKLDVTNPDSQDPNQYLLRLRHSHDCQRMHEGGKGPDL